MSAKEFASDLGVSARSLQWWKWRLASEVQDPTPRRRAGRRAIEEQKPASVTFVEIPQVSTPSISSAPIEIVLPSRIHVCVHAHFDASTLERVLDVLERRQ
ncbi:MAG TPA: hypothetical protein VM925_01845 [Labilithrix sp.]|nr:hypothetical protein [Labilithrix sp.]